ncbi:unnamed protein product [Mytilus coruscus]|uniref:Reverse transcriptase domain-containing protein n=1 Tax=Mytilus coruscus TaxID=42192 RepID=A0A6J8ENP2_MYTCO|nr:unnamed protein product [Mytilus coruscus]
MLAMYHDSDVVNFLEYGFPLSCKGSCSGLAVEKNHAGARSHPDDMRKYLKKECTYGSIIGPFFSNPFDTDMVISPLNSVPKKDTLDRRVILDLSFGVDGEDSVNSHICKDLYLGNPIKVSHPSVDSLVELIRRKGSGSLCFKRDLKRAYRQIPICPGDWHLVGFSWENHIFFDLVLSMGLRSAAYICQRVTNAVSFILDAHYDLQILNYLDDLAGCDAQEKAFDAYAILGEVLDNCGLEESVEKATPPSTSMVFLGILFDTKKLRDILEMCGLDSSKFSSHSFRRGGATWAFHSKVPSELIQFHGDWRSNAYKVYLEFDLHDKLSISRAMAEEIPI